MAQTTFKRNIEDFTCGHCGHEVKGNGFTNHCPKCLWSKHVDINPGDRAELCRGLMEPVSLELRKGDYTIIHLCTDCGHKQPNKAAPDDDIGGFLSGLAFDVALRRRVW